ncbi:MAG TPA: sigma-70 family RNA polymerase sigma factor [Thermoanaerobaculia bacterium]|nr:sigma-70 family RNA polymerase sigma factor [Thermoanaerobaculia bacterium]
MERGEDEADVDAVLSGDVERFAAIVARWEGPLLKLAWRFVHDRERAEEMAQEAFMQCFRRLRQWRGDSRFGTWLFSVALNVYRSRLRTLGRRAPHEPLPGDLPGPDDAGPRLLAEERRGLVRREVARLPLHYREALVLFYFEEQDVAAAAAHLGVPVGTFKARLHRGREMLKERLRKVME